MILFLEPSNTPYPTMFFFYSSKSTILSFIYSVSQTSQYCVSQNDCYISKEGGIRKLCNQNEKSVRSSNIINPSVNEGIKIYRVVFFFRLLLSSPASHGLCGQWSHVFLGLKIPSTWGRLSRLGYFRPICRSHIQTGLGHRNN